jgi:hypothetical protein
MDPENPTVPNSLFDLEIKCGDNKSIYVSRASLTFILPYFKILLFGNFSEASSNIISLSYKSSVLIILFKCILFGFMGVDYIKRELNEIPNDNVCDFLYACDEYQIKYIIMLADEYFSSDEKIMIHFNAEFINTIYLLKLDKLQNNIRKMIRDNKIKLTDLNFELMDCATLLLFNTWDYFLPALNLWLDKHQPNDEELIKSKIFDGNYDDLFDSLILPFNEILEKMKTCPITVNKIKIAIYDSKFNTKNKLQLSNKSDGTFYYIINETKENYIKLNGSNTIEIIREICARLYKKGIWVEGNKIYHDRQLNYMRYNDISIIMKYIDSISI